MLSYSIQNDSDMEYHNNNILKIEHFFFHILIIKDLAALIKSADFDI